MFVYVCQNGENFFAVGLNKAKKYHENTVSGRVVDFTVDTNEWATERGGLVAQQVLQNFTAKKCFAKIRLIQLKEDKELHLLKMSCYL